MTLPGVGAFIPVMRSAEFEGDVLSAPRLSVSFDGSFAAEDDTLTLSVARKNECEINDAKLIVDQEVAELTHSLSIGRAVELPGVGSLSPLYSTPEFHAFESFTSADWLEPLTLTPLEVRRASDAAVAKATEALEERRSSFMRALSRTASSAAAIAVLALITFVLTQLPGRGKTTAQTASFGIETIAPEPIEPLITTPGSTEPALVLILNTPSDGVAPARRRVERHALQPDRYIMVVASLASEREANSFIKAHSKDNVELQVLPMDGRWRVFALSAPTFEEINALAKRQDIYSAFPSAWVCRR